MTGDDERREDSQSRPANQRGAARLAAVQALYQMDIGGVSVEETLAQFMSHRLGPEADGDEYRPADADFFRQIVNGVIKHQLDIDPRVNAALARDWPMTRVDATLRAILRAGAFELLRRRDIPSRVVITEYVDVAKAFHENEVPGVVNAVLDAIAREIAAEEANG